MAARASSHNPAQAPPATAAVRRRQEKRVGLSLDLEPAGHFLSRDWSPAKPPQPPTAPARTAPAAASAPPTSAAAPPPAPPPAPTSLSALAAAGGTGAAGAAAGAGPGRSASAGELAELLEESMLRSSQFFAYRRLKELQRQHGGVAAHTRSAPALPQWLPKEDLLGGAAFVGYFNAPGERTHRAMAAEAAREGGDEEARMAAAIAAAAPPPRRRKERHKRRRRHGADELNGGQTARGSLQRAASSMRQTFRFGGRGSGLARTSTWARPPSAATRWSSDSSESDDEPGLPRAPSGPDALATGRSVLSSAPSEGAGMRGPDRKAYMKLYQRSRDLQTAIPDPSAEERAMAEAAASAQTTGELVAARFVNKCSEMRLTPMAIAVNLERRSAPDPAASPPASPPASSPGAPPVERAKTRITLDLSHFSLGDAMSRAVAHSVQDGGAKVEALKLRENRISAEGSAAIAEALRVNPHIRILDLSANALGTEGCSALASALSAPTCCLAELKLTENKLTGTAIRTLCGGLYANTSLTALDLSRNAINETGALALAHALLSNSALRELDLSWNKIRGRAGAALAKALGTNEGLTSVSLAWNGLSDIEGQALGAALRTNEAIARLDVSHNRLQGRSCAALRHAFIVNETLTELSLAANPIGPEGAKQLILAMEADAADGIERRLDLTDCDLQLGDDLLIGTSVAAASAPPLPQRARRRFDPNEPAGLYVLELVDPYERAVAMDLLQLARMAAEHDPDQGSAMLQRTATLNGAPVEVERLVAMMMREREGPGRTAPAPDDDAGSGQEPNLDGLPTGGRLEVEFAFARWRPQRPAYDETVEGLRRAVDSRPGPLAVLLRLAAEVLYFEVEQVAALLEDIGAEAGSTRVDILASLWLRLLDPENRAPLLADLPHADALALRRALGAPAYHFALHNPTGAYRLDLALPHDRQVALWLQGIGNDERLARTAAGVPDTSQAGNGENWRNVRLNGAPFAYSGTTAFPPAGTLELDYVSTALAPLEATALSDGAFRALLEGSRQAAGDVTEDDGDRAREDAFTAAADFGGQLRRYGGSRVPRPLGPAGRRASVTAGGDRRASLAGTATAPLRPATVGEEGFSRAGRMYVDMLFAAAADPNATVKPAAKGPAWPPRGLAEADASPPSGASSDRSASPPPGPAHSESAPALPALPGPSRSPASRPASVASSRPAASAALLAALPRSRVPAEAELPTAPARRPSLALRRGVVEAVPPPQLLREAAARLRRLRAEHTNDQRTWFTARQVRLVMDSFEAGVHKVEALVTLFGRVVDLPNVWRECVAGEPGASGLIDSPRPAIARVGSLRRTGSSTGGSSTFGTRTGGRPGPREEDLLEEEDESEGEGPEASRRHVRLPEGEADDGPDGGASAAGRMSGRGPVATASGRGAGLGRPLPKAVVPLACARLGVLNLLNPVDLEGYLLLDLTAREDHVAARIVVEACTAESKDASAFREAFYNGNGFTLPASWSPTPPKRGIVALVYAAPLPQRLWRRRAALAARHTLAAAALPPGEAAEGLAAGLASPVEESGGSVRRGAGPAGPKKKKNAFDGFRIY